MKKNNIFPVIVILFMAILCVGFVGLSGAWFFATDSEEITITLANGIQIEATGLSSLSGALQNSGAYQLKLTNNSAVAPGATVNVENVKLKIKSGVNSADAYVRFKLGYEYKERGGEWQTGTYSNCNLTNEIAISSASPSSAGFKQVGDWCYYFNNSTANTYENLAVLTTTNVSLFSNNQQLVLSESVPSGSEIRITLTIDAVQATQNAVKAEWSGSLS